ncbi:MAG: SdpI family protein [Candidatus Paceibacterota bacterium]
MDYIPTLTFFIVGILFAIISLPLIYRKIPVNIVYGFRISKYVFIDKDIWYTVNELGGKYFFGIGIILLLLSFVSMYASPELLYQILIPFEIAFIITGVFYTWYKTLICTYSLARKKGHKK